MSKAVLRGIGVDAVKISRMDPERMGLHVLKRMFHAQEVEQLKTMQQGQSEFLASRFAAKEALVKALGTGFRGISPSEICVIVDATGKPEFLLSDELKIKLTIESVGLHLSITHEGDLAIAFVVVEDIDGAC